MHSDVIKEDVNYDQVEGLRKIELCHGLVGGRRLVGLRHGQVGGCRRDVEQPEFCGHHGRVVDPECAIVCVVGQPRREFVQQYNL